MRRWAAPLLFVASVILVLAPWAPSARSMHPSEPFVSGAATNRGQSVAAPRTARAAWPG